jgi:hypothetical protein
MAMICSRHATALRDSSWRFFKSVMSNVIPATPVVTPDASRTQAMLSKR